MPTTRPRCSLIPHLTPMRVDSRGQLRFPTLRLCLFSRQCASLTRRLRLCLFPVRDCVWESCSRPCLLIEASVILNRHVGIDVAVHMVVGPSIVRLMAAAGIGTL